jgi:putative transposase
MTNYRRNFIPGASFFFTVNLADRRQRLLVDNVELLRAAFRKVHVRHPFTIDAIVVLPDHIHTIWTLPEGDGDYALRWRQIKSRFSRGLPPLEYLSRSRAMKRERGIWQRRYWEHTLRAENDFARMWIMSTTIRSSMAMRLQLAPGHIPPSRGWCGQVLMRKIGMEMASPASRVLANHDGFRCALPILQSRGVG